jgi:HD superfamily phosphodiesterase
MSRLENLEALVRELYKTRNPNRADWADWLYKNHIFVVALTAKSLAERFNVNSELPQAAAILHDVADAKVARKDPSHERASMDMARVILAKSGYTAQEIQIIVDDAIRYHGCKNGKTPKTETGKILATADALAHLNSDFYAYAMWATGKYQTFEQSKAWASQKIDRDFHDKILFKEIKAELEPQYELLKKLFLSI